MSAIIINFKTRRILYAPNTRQEIIQKLPTANYPQRVKLLKELRKLNKILGE